MQTTFRRQAFQGFLLTIVLALFIGMASVLGLSWVNESKNAIVEQDVRALTKVYELQVLHQSTIASNRAFLLSGDALYLSELHQHRQTFATTAQELAGQLSDAQSQAMLKTALKAEREYQAAMDRLADKRMQGIPSRALILLFQQQIQPKRQLASNALHDLRDRAWQQMHDAHAHSEIAADRAIILIFSGVLAAVTLTIGIGLFDRRRLMQTFQALESSQARLTGIVDSAMDAVISIDDRQRIVLFNQAAEKIFGHEAEAVMGQPLGILIPDAQRERHGREINQFGQTGITTRKMGNLTVLHGLRHNGDVFPIEATISKVRTADETLYTAIVRDITERVRTDRDRERLLNETQQAVRLRDEFLSVASHELKTPLTTLNLQIETLERLLAKSAPPEDDRVAAKIQTLRRQTDRLKGLVEDMLDVSNIAEGRLSLLPEPIDLSQLVRDVVERFRDAADKQRIDLSLSVEPAVTGTWDPMRVEQILTNLLSNALKYGAGKPVDVALSSTPDQAMLTVTDQGIGISQEDQTRIFMRYTRAVSERYFGGLGLGLWITQEIVDAMQGTIAVHSELGQGSRFQVVLPRTLS